MTADDVTRDDIMAYLRELDEGELPPDEPPSGDVQRHLIYVNLLDDEILDRVPKYRHPLAGDQLRGTTYDNHTLLAEIVRVAEELGHPPTSTDFQEHGQCSLGPYKDRFMTFPRAVEAAGYDPKFTSAQQKARYLREYEDLADVDSNSA